MSISSTISANGRNRWHTIVREAFQIVLYVNYWKGIETKFIDPWEKIYWLAPLNTIYSIVFHALFRVNNK